MQYLLSYWPYSKSSAENVFQSDIIDSGISDYQVRSFRRKMKPVKFNKYNNVLQRFLTHCSHFLSRSFPKSQDWFGELIHSCGILFLLFKVSKLLIGDKIYKKI